MNLAIVNTLDECIPLRSYLTYCQRYGWHVFILSQNHQGRPLFVDGPANEASYEEFDFVFGPIPMGMDLLDGEAP